MLNINAPLKKNSHHNKVCPCGQLATHRSSGEMCCASCHAIESRQPVNKTRYNAGTKRYQMASQNDIRQQSVDYYRLASDTGKTQRHGVD